MPESGACTLARFARAANLAGSNEGTAGVLLWPAAGAGILGKSDDKALLIPGDTIGAPFCLIPAKIADKSIPALVDAEAESTLAMSAGRLPWASYTHVELCVAGIPRSACISGGSDPDATGGVVDVPECGRASDDERGCGDSGKVGVDVRGENVVSVYILKRVQREMRERKREKEPGWTVRL
jgi:hypothetical protein